MAITTALSNAFKLELLKGNHDFDSDTFRVALIKENPVFLLLFLLAFSKKTLVPDIKISLHLPVFLT